MLRFALCLTLVKLTLMTPVLADSPEQRGNAYAKARCARCHAIDRAGPSPLQIAPP
jgi:cytochrome c2